MAAELRQADVGVPTTAAHRRGVQFGENEIKWRRKPRDKRNNLKGNRDCLQAPPAKALQPPPIKTHHRYVLFVRLVPNHRTSLSNGRAASDPCQVTGNGITCIISVTENSSPPPGVECVHIPLSDSPWSPLRDHFDDVADRIQATAERCGRTLVHCNAGVSRSAALCMAYLMKHHGATLLEAHSWVKSCRPIVRPNNGFWKQLVQYEAQLRGCNSIRMVTSSIGEIPDIYKEESRNMVPL